MASLSREQSEELAKAGPVYPCLYDKFKKEYKDIIVENIKTLYQQVLTHLQDY